MYTEITKPASSNITWENEERMWEEMTMSWDSIGDNSIPKPSIPIITWDSGRKWDGGKQWDGRESNYKELVRSSMPIRSLALAPSWPPAASNASVVGYASSFDFGYKDSSTAFAF